MQPLALALPPAHVFEGMRAVIAGRQVSGATLLAGAVLAAMYVLLASWFFRSVYRYAVRTGLVARYSAESVT
jgi:ABC-2 type transport system permease protein